VKALLSWIQVVELKRTDVTVVAAKPACAARLLDEDPFDAPTAFGDLLRSTMGAPKAAVPLIDEVNGSMTLAEATVGWSSIGSATTRTPIQGL
jgi:hypothetical protein